MRTRRDGRGLRRARDGDAAPGRPGSPSRRGRRRRGERSRPRCGRTGSGVRRSPRLVAAFGRALLVEELAPDAVRVADEDVGSSAGAAQRAVGDGQVVLHEVQLGVAASGKSTFAGLVIVTSRPAATTRLPGVSGGAWARAILPRATCTCYGATCQHVQGATCGAMCDVRCPCDVRCHVRRCYVLRATCGATCDVRCHVRRAVPRATWAPRAT